MKDGDHSPVPALPEFRFKGEYASEYIHLFECRVVGCGWNSGWRPTHTSSPDSPDPGHTFATGHSDFYKYEIRLSRMPMKVRQP